MGIRIIESEYKKGGGKIITKQRNQFDKKTNLETRIFVVVVVVVVVAVVRE